MAEGLQLAQQSSLSQNTCNILVTSDWHSYITNAKRATSMMDYAPIEQALCLGDILPDRWNDQLNLSIYPYWDKTLLVLGNHDVLGGTGWDWTVQPSPEQQYNRFYAPYVGSNGSTMIANTTYWYKDIHDGKIRLIGLDSMNLDATYQQRMLSWLKGLLSESLEKGQHVVIARHWGYGAPSQSEQVWCPYSIYPANEDANLAHSGLEQLRTFETQILNAVDDFIGEGGLFVCHLLGHKHFSWVGRYPMKNGNQLGIVTPSILNDSWNRTLRNSQTIGFTGFNVVSIDTDRKSIALQAYGAKLLKTGGTLETAVFDYNGNILDY